MTSAITTTTDPADGVYRSRSTKARRTRSSMDALRTALVSIVAAGQPMTVRQVFYQAVSQGLIDKTEAEYKQTVVRLLTEMRRDGRIPFSCIADNTRWMRKPTSYTGLRAMLEDTATFYRRDLWANQDAYVEVWLEKDALAGVVYEVTEEFDVPLMVTRGYSSLSFLHSAAEAIAAQQKPAYLYYFGDWDPSGKDINRAVEAGIREMAPDAEIHFARVAVTEHQIDHLHLPTRPTKKTDTRTRSFTGESVELDAIPPEHLRQLVRERIERHIDRDQFERLLTIEREERATLERIASVIEPDSNGELGGAQ